MEVLQKAADTVTKIASNALGKIQNVRHIHIYVSNCTEVAITTLDSSPNCSASLGESKSLPAGNAGVLRFSNKGELRGDVKLTVGECSGETLGVRAYLSVLGVSEVNIQFSSDEKLPRSNWVKVLSSATVMGTHFAAHVRAEAGSTECMVHIAIGNRSLGGRFSRRSLRSSLHLEPIQTFGCLFEEWHAVQFLRFAEFCSSKNSYGLIGALFLMEFHAVITGFEGLPLTDRAYMLNLLIGAFISNGVVYLHDLVSPAALEPARALWASQEPKAFAPYAKKPVHRRLGRYEVYGKLGLSDSELRAYVDSAILLLKTTSIQVWLALAASAQQLLDRGVHERSPIDRPSQVRSLTSLTTEFVNIRDEMLFQQFGTESMKTCRSTSSQRTLEDLDQEHKLVVLVRKCVHISATFSIRSDRLFECAESQIISAESRQAFRSYRSFVPGARRRFSVGAANMDEADEVLGMRSKRCVSCCSSMGSKWRSAATVHCDTMGTECFANLDGKSVASPQQVLASLGCTSQPYRTMSTNSKSGEFFFFSGDRLFLIKTISEDEGKLLFNMLPGYQEHIRTKPESLIVRYAGLYCLELAGIGKKYFSIMASVFDPAVPIHSTFDLKGSMFKRKKKEGEQIGKDEDWVTSQQRLHVSREIGSDLCAAHEQDAAFLMQHEVMDYSLLIGINNDGRGPPDGDGHQPESGDGWRNGSGPGGGIWSRDSQKLYFVGTIDFLIRYSVSKQGEHFLRFAQGHSEDASCVDPACYAKRQVRFVRDQVISTPPLEGKEVIPGTEGILRVKVTAAHGLKAADVTGSSDPYVYVSLGLQRQRTPTVCANCDPRWDCELLFAVDEGHFGSEVSFTVWDEDIGTFQGSDDFLGQMSVPVEEVVAKDAVELKQQTLKGVKQGKLSVILEFVKGQKRFFTL